MAAELGELQARLRRFLTSGLASLLGGRLTGVKVVCPPPRTAFWLSTHLLFIPCSRRCGSGSVRASWGCEAGGEALQPARPLSYSLQRYSTHCTISRILKYGCLPSSSLGLSEPGPGRTDSGCAAKLYSHFNRQELDDKIDASHLDGEQKAIENSLLAQHTDSSFRIQEFNYHAHSKLHCTVKFLLCKYCITVNIT